MWILLERGMVKSLKEIKTMTLFEVEDEKKRDVLELKSTIKQDDITRQITTVFDYAFDGTITTDIYIPKFPKEFGIGLIVGSSGSGKSTLLHQLGEVETIEWDNDKAIASHFEDFETASNMFGAVGLNSIPTWLKPYRALSNGEQFRADMARRLHSNTIIDEFTSVVNRECAVSCSTSISKYIKSNGLHNIIFASCHDDIIPFLQPDWIYNTDKKELFNGRCPSRPKITLKVNSCSKSIWDEFARHYYLSGELNNASVCYLASYNDMPVAFVALLTLPGRDVKHAWREHRLVVLPDFQGMGIGNAFSEYIGDLYVRRGCRYFCKTSNPRIGEHRNKSRLWRATATNGQARESYLNKDGSLRDWNPRYGMKQDLVKYHAHRVCYSHEYIGSGEVYPFTLFEDKTNKLF